MQKILDLGGAEPGHGSAGPSFALRPYQAEALEAVKAAIAAGDRRCLIALPTGCGKTICFSHLPATLELGNKRMLVLAHRAELLDQAARKLRAVNPNMSVGIEQAGRRAGDAQVVVASVATLQGDRLEALDASEFGAVVVDEAHHSIAKSYTTIFEHFGCATKDATIPLIGVTATPRRGDGVGLSKCFDTICFDAPMYQMILDGYLARITGLRLDTATDLSNITTRMGEFATGELAEACNTEKRNEIVVSGYLEKAAERTKTLCFAVDVAHAEDLANGFALAGISAGVIHGKMPDEHRARALEDFHRGEIEVLTNCMVLTEGFDEPGVDCILMARPTKSSLLYTQMIGRGTRPSPDTGKDDCLVIDCTDNSGRHDLVSVSTLFGLPKRIDLQGHDALDVADQLELLGTDKPWINLDSIRSLDDLNVCATKIEFFAAAVPPELQNWTIYQWVKRPDGSFKLPLPDREAIYVEATRLDTFRVAMRVRLDVEEVEGEKPKKPKFKLGQLAEVSTLREAIKAGDAAVRGHRREATKLLDTRARWRASAATPKQVALLSRMKIEHPPEITKGQAATILTLAFNRKRKKSTAGDK